MSAINCIRPIRTRPYSHGNLRGQKPVLNQGLDSTKVEEQHATFLQGVDDGFYAVFILRTDGRTDIHAILYHVRIIDMVDERQVFRHGLAGRKPGGISFHHDRIDTETFIVVLGTAFEIVAEIISQRRVHRTVLQWKAGDVVTHIILRNDVVAILPNVAEEVTTEAIAHVARNATIIATAKDIFHHGDGYDIIATNDEYWYFYP